MKGSMWTGKVKKVVGRVRRLLTLPMFRRVFRAALFLGAAGFVMLLGFFAYYAKDLPNPDDIGRRQIAQSTKIYAKDSSTVLYDIHGEEKRTVIPVSEIPNEVKLATVAIEDHAFYRHHGIYLRGILRAFFANIRGQRIAQGGSTITQQYIKNSLLTLDRTWNRKFKEVVLSLELELKYPKDEILGFYLNEVSYGNNAYGIEAASQTYFSKPAKELSLAEAALLASLPQAPSYYSPYGNHPEELRARQRLVLTRMHELGFISEEKKMSALGEELRFTKAPQRIVAPHFVMMVREYLNTKYGEEYVERAGLKVFTTLDTRLQGIAEETVRTQLDKNPKRYRAGNAALVATDPKTGHILAMVGSRDYFDLARDGNVNVATRLRQPGSSFKPFAYARAFQLGYTPNTIVFDLSTEFGTGGKNYRPHNYDYRFRGPVTLRNALAQSLNIPAIKVLYLAGIHETIDLAHAMGITSLQDRERYGLALVLGGGEVRLVDMVAAYGVFANDGVRNPATAITRIEDGQGKILEEWKPQPHEVVTPQIARLISDVLSDNAARAPIFGSRSALVVPGYKAAAKTGTTQEFRDGWTIGYTPDLAAGVWVGNNDNSPMTAAGSLVAAPLWGSFMKAALPHFLSSSFIPPDPVQREQHMLNGRYLESVRVRVNKANNKLATDKTPPDLVEEREYATTHTILHYVNKSDVLGDPPKNPASDPQYVNWETAVQTWVNDPKRSEEGLYFTDPPTEYDEGGSTGILTVFIASPSEGARVQKNAISIQLSFSGDMGSIEQADYFLDGILLGSSKSPPYSLLTKAPPHLPSGTSYELRVKIFLTSGSFVEAYRNIYLEDGIEE